MTLSRITLITSLLALVASTAFAGTIRVGPHRTYTTIQDGVDNASAGDTILIDKGVYVETVVVETADLTIQPAKKGKQGKVTIDAGGVGSPLTVIASGVVVKDLRVSNAPNGTAGILVGNGNADIKLIRCTVMGGLEDYGIYVAGAPNCIVSKCKVFNAGDTGIYIDFLTQGTVVTKCTVKDAGGNGIEVDDTLAITITDNKIIRSGEDGIHLGETADTVGCLISGNEVQSASERGIRCNSFVSFCVFEKNILRKNEYGVETDLSTDCLWEENVCDDSLKNGFFLDGSSTTWTKNKCTDSGFSNFYFSNPARLILTKNKSRRAGLNGFGIAGLGHVVIKNDSRKSGQLDFDTTLAWTDCVYVGNIYDTSDF